MKVQVYQPLEHYEILLSWLRARDAHMPGNEEMPAIGFVAYAEEHPVAAGFIRRVEGGLGQLDGLTTNPWMPADLRSRGIDFVVETIIDEAKGLGIKNLMAFTSEPNVLIRSAKFGFVQSNHVVIALKTN